MLVQSPSLLLTSSGDGGGGRASHLDWDIGISIGLPTQPSGAHWNRYNYRLEEFMGIGPESLKWIQQWIFGRFELANLS